MKIDDLITGFKRYALIEKGITSKTTKEIISIVSRLSEFENTSCIRTATTNRIRDFLYMEKEERLWTNRTFRNKRQYLKTFFDFCLNRGYIRKNPIDSIEKPKVRKALPRCLNQREVDELLMQVDCYPWRTELEAKRNRALFRAFLYAGVRLSELLNLKTNRVNLEEREILVYKGKGGKDRIVPIHSRLIPYLHAYMKAKTIKNEYFFSSVRSDSRLTEKNLYTVFKKIKRECGFQVTPHMLRHTMAKSAIEANLNPFMLQTILGHANISTTQIYVSVSNRKIKEAYETLDLI